MRHKWAEQSSAGEHGRKGQGGREMGRLAGGGGCCDRWAAAGCFGCLRFYVTAWWLLLTIWMMMMLRSLCCCLCCCLCRCFCCCLCCCCVNPGKNKQQLDEKHILQEQEKNQNANSQAHRHIHTHGQAHTHTCTLSTAVLMASTLTLLPTSTSTIFSAADIVKSLRRATFEFSWVCITFTFACGRRHSEALIFR